jgi:hypothetical protein
MSNSTDEIDRCPTLFRTNIVGDSMTPEHQSGDIIEFELLRDGKPALQIGRHYFIHHRDGKGTFKRLEKIEVGTLTFVALNREKYPEPFVMRRTEIKRMALAIGRFIPATRMLDIDAGLGGVTGKLKSPSSHGGESGKRKKSRSAA